LNKYKVRGSRKGKGKVFTVLKYNEHGWRGGGIAPPFLTTALDGGEWSTSRYDYFISEEKTPVIR
jgi:hypothetical protein